MTIDDLERVVNALPQPIAKLLSSSFVRYVIGGCIAAGAHLMVVAAAVELADIDVENANSMGFVVGVFINYTFQRTVTFRDHARRHVEQMPLFIGFAVLGLGINRYVYAHGIHDFHLQYLIAAAMAILVVFVFNFTANSLVTFRPRSKNQSTSTRYAASGRPRSKNGVAETAVSECSKKNQSSLH